MPKFTQQHYEAIAQVFKDEALVLSTAWPVDGPFYSVFRAEWCDLQDRMVTMFHADNPRFKETRFRKWCDPG